ncbi:hypothetical protein DFR67_1232 [Williamsia limnetica]|uniref:Uncharacterized protein n=1 Tax=Williamsia limnetica TaxID=882452 RepID=A0A318REX9_WILLI|nr:hypothetical protein DFR67_1232 [Williamsia limnetica]
MELATDLASSIKPRKSSLDEIPAGGVPMGLVKRQLLPVAGKARCS